MTTIDTTIAGIPCLAELTHYRRARPMLITGSGFGDAEPPEPEEIEYRILTRDGRPAGNWLLDKLTPEDDVRIQAALERAEEEERREGAA